MAGRADQLKTFVCVMKMVDQDRSYAVEQIKGGARRTIKLSLGPAWSDEHTYAIRVQSAV
jgi:hypothetical protein